jgi:hypothetical protein
MSVQKFIVRANDKLSIRGKEYIVAPHPAVAKSMNMAYEQSGRKGTVVQLRDVKDNTDWALKYMHVGYRNSTIFDDARKLEALHQLEGLTVCKRAVLTKETDKELLDTHPALEFAVLMPWIEGNPWSTILSLDPNRGFKYEQSVALASHFTQVMTELEDRSIAHTDIAGDNVIVGSDNRVYLVDVEDMYGQGFSTPREFNQGHDGYRHRAATGPSGQWHAAGDRFCVAIMVVEMLIWAEKKARLNKKNEQPHFFRQKEMQLSTSIDYSLAREILAHQYSRELCDLFDTAWLSTDFDTCPLIRQWSDIVHKLQPTSAAITAEPSIISQPASNSLALPRRHLEISNLPPFSITEEKSEGPPRYSPERTISPDLPSTPSVLRYPLSPPVAKPSRLYQLTAPYVGMFIGAVLGGLLALLLGADLASVYNTVTTISYLNGQQYPSMPGYLAGYGRNYTIVGETDSELAYAPLAFGVDRAIMSVEIESSSTADCGLMLRSQNQGTGHTFTLGSDGVYKVWTINNGAWDLVASGDAVLSSANNHRLIVTASTSLVELFVDEQSVWLSSEGVMTNADIASVSLNDRGQETCVFSSGFVWNLDVAR